MKAVIDPVGAIVLALLLFFFGRGIFRSWQARIAAERATRPGPVPHGAASPSSPDGAASRSSPDDTVIDVEAIDVTDQRRNS